MALPVIAVGLLARLLLRGGIAAARKYAAKNGVRISANVLSKAKNINKTKKAVNPRLKVKKLKAKEKVEFKPTSAKQKNIKAKTDKKYDLKTKKKTTTKTKPTDTSKIKTKKKVDKKVDKKSIATKSKDTKVKTSKKSDKKVDKKSLATKSKDTKVKTKTDKKVTKKVDKKSLATKKKTDTKALKKLNTIVPSFGGGMLLGGLIASQNKKTKPTDTNKIKIKPKPKPDPKKSIGGTGRGEGALEYARRKSDSEIAKMKEKESRESRKLYQTAQPSATFEARVRALVAQKDKLKNIDAGDGRSEYQVRINKLKKENKKAFKKMFKLGGFGNLKD